jgi:hypothetical protein
VLHKQGKVESAEAEMEYVLGELYATVDDHRLPDGVKTALENKIASTNQSLQVLFTVSALLHSVFRVE